MRSIPALFLAVAALAAPSAAQTVLFSEDFESGYSRWTMQGLWNEQDASEACSAVALPFPSGTHCAWYGGSSGCTFNVSVAPPFEYLTCTESIVLPATDDVLELGFRSLSDGEDDEIWDTRKVQISANGGTTWESVATLLSSDRWTFERFDISRFAGQSILLRFEFWIGDITDNAYLGWMLDDVQIVERPGPAVDLCFGDGTWIDCPCGNNGGAGRGCASSFNPNGARITASGSASLAADTLVLSADGMSSAAATIIQGAGFQYGASWFIGGDGLSCIRPPFVRIRTQAAPGGVTTYPSAGDTAISVRGVIPGPSTVRTYMVRYRNAAPGFCSTSTFNTTNTVQLTWRP